MLISPGSILIDTLWKKVSSGHPLNSQVDTKVTITDNKITVNHQHFRRKDTATQLNRSGRVQSHSLDVCVWQVLPPICKVLYIGGGVLSTSLPPSPISSFLFFFYYLFSFWPHCTVCRILVPQPQIKPTPPAVEVSSPNHWTPREGPVSSLL